MLSHKISNLPSYPTNGNHLQCETGLTFYITRGMDEFYYFDKKKKKHVYNKGSNGDDRWFVELYNSPNKSLMDIFECKVNNDLYKILAYCEKVYKRSLVLEIKRLNKELEKLSS